MSLSTDADWETLLDRCRSGDLRAETELIERLTPLIRIWSRARLRKERAGHSWSESDLVQETLLKIWKSPLFTQARTREQLVSALSRAMGQVLIDHSRIRNARKRAGGAKLNRQPFDEALERLSAHSIDTDRLVGYLGEIARSRPDSTFAFMLAEFMGYSIDDLCRLLACSREKLLREISTLRGAVVRDLLMEEG
ncbi:MAG: ECF-type sigma factor [Isosphaeraceae bacterium]|nr:ECF-type sigma factor [Isosphaeraceae bacterium]